MAGDLNLKLWYRGAVWILLSAGVGPVAALTLVVKLISGEWLFPCLGEPRSWMFIAGGALLVAITLRANQVHSSDNVSRLQNVLPRRVQMYKAVFDRVAAGKPKVRAVEFITQLRADADVKVLLAASPSTAALLEQIFKENLRTEQDAKESKAAGEPVPKGVGYTTWDAFVGRIFAAGYLGSAMRELFDSLDANGDGSLSPGELRSGLSRPDLRFVLGLTEDTDAATLERVFRTMDRNQDNKVSWSEFVAAVDENLERTLREVFRSLDKDADGNVDLSEFEQGMKANKQFKQLIALAQNDTREIITNFQALDRDGNGKLSWQEFSTYVL